MLSHYWIFVYTLKAIGGFETADKQCQQKLCIYTTVKPNKISLKILSLQFILLGL
jgi:hypothetical protein